MPEIIPSISCNLDADILFAALPLFQESRIGAIEWSFDTLYGIKQVPDWFAELLITFGAEGKLIGHGVYFSIFSGRWSAEQQNWLTELKELSQKYQFDHITEHFGFMTGQSFHDGAPLSIPYSETTLRIGRDRLSRIYDACMCPVGLENLAFSYSLDEVKRHGEFLHNLIEPVNGFIILDLHNLYCQMHNFSFSCEDLISVYPLDRVREIHISGGSWEDSSLTDKKIRRDTHDDAVPEEVFEMLKLIICRCPNLKFAVLEQLGDALKTHASRSAFYDDFVKMEMILKEIDPASSQADVNMFRRRDSYLLPDQIAEDEDLYRQQCELSDILETSSSYQHAQNRLASSSLSNTGWSIESWEPHMLETALKIARKWKK